MHYYARKLSYMQNPVIKREEGAGGRVEVKPGYSNVIWKGLQSSLNDNGF